MRDRASRLAFIVCFIFSTQAYTLLLHPFYVAAGLLAIRAQEAKSASPDFGHQAVSMLNSTKNMFLVLAGMKDLPPVPGQVTHLVFTAPLEFFFTKVKLSGLGAVALSFPVLGGQIYAFVAPEFYKRAASRFSAVPQPASPLLLLAGAAMVYFMIMPFLLWFSLSQQIVEETPPGSQWNCCRRFRSTSTRS